MGVTVDLGDDLAGAKLLQNSHDSLIEVMIPEKVGHVWPKEGITLEKTGRNVSRNYNFGTAGHGCKFETSSKQLRES